MAIVAYIDGGARGNPGPAGYGVRIEDEQGTLVNEFNGFLGTSTNNVAEYNGLLAALKYAQQHGYRTVRIKSDSELLVKQMRGEYKVKNAGLLPLYQQARTIAQTLDRIVYEHVRREQNKDADRLANLAMDEGTKSRDRIRDWGLGIESKTEPAAGVSRSSRRSSGFSHVSASRTRARSARASSARLTSLGRAPSIR